MVELFPVSVRSMGVGIPPAFGGFASMLSQVIFMSAYEKVLNFFVVLSIFFGLNLVLMLGVSETYGKEDQDNIEEVAEEYLKKRSEIE